MYKRVIRFLQVFCFICFMMVICAFTANGKKQTAINLRDYGAVGDGHTDDYVAIYNAMHAAMDTSRALYIPEGDYYCSSTIVLEKNIKIYGDGKDKSSISFLNEVTNKRENHTRGMITFCGDVLSIRDLTLRYDANSSTLYTIGNGAYKPGLLLCVLKANSVSLTNSSFIAGGGLNPPVTSIWFKAEFSDISNVVIDHCDIINTSHSMAGGGLWISAHDTDAVSVHDVLVTNCYFDKHGNDEAFALWGHRISNITVSDNHLNYSGNKNDVLVTLGNSGCRGIYTNVVFSNNTIDIANISMFAVKVEHMSEGSSVTVNNNTINASLVDVDMFSSFIMSSLYGANFCNNTVNITGGGVVSYMLYGNDVHVVVDNDTFTTNNSTLSMVVRANGKRALTYADFNIENSHFYLGVKSPDTEYEYVQFPINGRLNMRNCEIRVQ